MDLSELDQLSIKSNSKKIKKKKMDVEDAPNSNLDLEDMFSSLEDCLKRKYTADTVQENKVISKTILDCDKKQTILRLLKENITEAKQSQDLASRYVSKFIKLKI